MALVLGFVGLIGWDVRRCWGESYRLEAWSWWCDDVCGCVCICVEKWGIEEEKGREGKGRKENRRGNERRGGQTRKETTREPSRMCKKRCVRKTFEKTRKKNLASHQKPLHMSENVRHSVTFRIDTMAYKHFITTTSSTTTTTTSISRFFSFSTSHRRVIHSSIQLVGPSVR